MKDAIYVDAGKCNLTNAVLAKSNATPSDLHLYERICIGMITFRSIRPKGEKASPDRGWLARWYLTGILIAIGQLVTLEPVQAQTINTYKQYTFIQLNYNFKEFYCVSDLWYLESRWNYKAKNPKSSAMGIPQLLNMKSKDPFYQIDQGLKYIKHRHQTACNALAFHKKKGWY